MEQNEQPHQPKPTQPPEAATASIEDVWDHVSTVLRYQRETQAQIERLRESIFWLGVIVIVGVLYLESK